MFPCNYPRVTGPRFLLGLVSVLLFSLVLLAGCGGGDSGEKGGESAVLAQVGDMEITAEMYEKGLSKLELKELPKADGLPVDTSTIAGKKEILQLLITKELMRQKAIQLGYEQDPQAVSARASLTAYEAGLALWSDVVGNPANSISNEELDEFYKKMGVSRVCQFVICNFFDDAEKARDFAKSGADWDEVVSEYHDGSPAPTGKYEIKVPFGQYSTSFEDKVFETPVGDVTDPIRTSYGFWVMRILEEKIGKKPALEDATARILDITRNRKLGRSRNEFKKQMQDDRKLFIDDEVLWICYQGIPEGGLMDPETNKPRPKDTLLPLDVPLSELGRIFYSYESNGELIERTLGDYKGHFDKMSVFQRPKKSDMLGGLREKIIQELERGFINDEAKKRGYYENPEVLAKVNEKVEEVMVTKLYGDVVKFDKRITAEQLDDFYQENKEKYFVPETRSGRLVICLNEVKAAEAKADAENGVPWRVIMKEFGSDRDNKSRGGKLEGVSGKGSGPVKDAMFGIEINQYSEPFLIDNGRYGVVMLESVQAPHQLEKNDISEEIGQQIRYNRKEEAYQALLAQWALDFGVTEFEENLAELPSWEELHTKVTPQNLVPRN